MYHPVRVHSNAFLFPHANLEFFAILILDGPFLAPNRKIFAKERKNASVVPADLSVVPNDVADEAGAVRFVHNHAVDSVVVGPITTTHLYLEQP